MITHIKESWGGVEKGSLLENRPCLNPGKLWGVFLYAVKSVDKKSMAKHRSEI